MDEEPSLVEELEALRDIDAIKQLRLVPKTRKSYESKNKIFLGFLRNNYPNMAVGANINLENLTLEAFQAFIVKKQGENRLSFSACSVRPRSRTNIIFPPPPRPKLPSPSKVCHFY